MNTDGAPEPGFVERCGGWDGVYRETAEKDLPWNAGGPDSALVRLVESGKLPCGTALDPGTGPGHDAAYLAAQGFSVTAVDISPRALAMARRTAEAAGVAEKIEFIEGDARTLALEAGAFSFINDRGCFHIFEDEDRSKYLENITQALAPGGMLFVRTFCDKEPPGPGPHHFTRGEILSSFKNDFELLSLDEGVFEGPRGPRNWQALFKRREERRAPSGPPAP